MIEQDLPNHIATSLFCTEIQVAVSDKIYYASAPEFDDDAAARLHAPYIVVEGPVDSERIRFSDGPSRRYFCTMRVNVFGLTMTEVSTILGLLDVALSPIQNEHWPHTYVQCFIRGDLYVDNRRLQRGKQEKNEDSSEDPLAEGHVDFGVWSSHKA